MKVDSSTTGIILAGGKNRRMKREKAFLKFGAKTIIEELISRLEKKFSKLIIIANDTKIYMKFGILTSLTTNPERKRRIGTSTSLSSTSLTMLRTMLSPSKHIANPECKRRKGIEVVSDIMPDKGPLGGIYTALVKSQGLYNFVFACDMPFINPDLIDYMVDKAEGVDIVVPRWQGKFEPLHAIYSKRCIEPIKIQLEKNDLKITNFFSQLNLKIIEQEEVERFGHSGTLFLNINTQEEYSAVARMPR